MLMKHQKKNYEETDPKHLSDVATGYCYNEVNSVNKLETKSTISISWTESNIADLKIVNYNTGHQNGSNATCCTKHKSQFQNKLYPQNNDYEEDFLA